MGYAQKKLNFRDWLRSSGLKPSDKLYQYSDETGEDLLGEYARGGECGWLPSGEGIVFTEPKEVGRDIPFGVTYRGETTVGQLAKDWDDLFEYVDRGEYDYFSEKWGKPYLDRVKRVDDPAEPSPSYVFYARGSLDGRSGMWRVRAVDGDIAGSAIDDYAMSTNREVTYGDFADHWMLPKGVRELWWKPLTDHITFWADYRES